jgi:adenosylhomocysteine nucleosidase
MLNWVTALHCEAKPVIDYYRLKKSPQLHAFEVYRGEDMTCIVSGTGKLASAAACAWLAAVETANSPAWINLGIAGAAEHDIGRAFVLDKIVDDDTGQSYFPAPVVPTGLPASACLTLSKPGYDYHEDSLFDMEASGYISSALRFSSAELVQSIKIVSDNRLQQTGRDSARVSGLIATQMESVVGLADGLLAIQREQSALIPPPEDWRQLMSLAHFSQTEQNRLRKLWSYLRNRGFERETLLRELGAGDSAGVIIERLETISHRDSEGL